MDWLDPLKRIILSLNKRRNHYHLTKYYVYVIYKLLIQDNHKINFNLKFDNLIHPKEENVKT